MPSEFHRQLADLSYDLVDLMHGEQEHSPSEVGKRVDAFLKKHKQEIGSVDKLALKNLSAQLRLLGLESNAPVYHTLDELHTRVGHSAYALRRQVQPTVTDTQPEAQFDPTKLMLEGRSDVTDEALIFIANSPDWSQLQKINLRLCTDITDKGIIALAQSPHLAALNELNLNGCLLLTDHAIAELVHSSRRWHALDLSHLDQLTDTSLEFIAQAESCKQLKRLRLFGSKGITDKGLHLLSVSANLKYLQELDLGGGLFRLTEQGIIDLANIISLKVLSLNECSGVTDKALERLATLPNLRRLDLADCPGISLEGLQVVAHLEI